MDLNNFVVVPNKPSSVKLKARSVRELRVDTRQLEQESRAMEERLQVLQQAMSLEKEERRKLGAFYWKSGQTGSMTATCYRASRSNESSSQKSSAGKLRVKVLKDEPVDVQRTAVRSMQPPPGELTSSRRPRLKGKPCGQCEERAAGVMCVECREDYCVGCFARFHHKGALKHHRMVPVQMEIHTSVSALDVVSRFRKQMEPNGTSAVSGGAAAAGPGVPRKGGVSEAHSCLKLAAERFLLEESEAEEDLHEGSGAESPSLLGGEFDEEESARSFQEALMQWRQSGGPAGCEQERTWQPMDALPVLREVTGTQADLVPDGPPIKVEFRDYGLSYMNKLLLKKHRRTPIEKYRPLLSMGSHQKCLMDERTLTDEEDPGLTAEEMEVKRYCASLFPVRVSPNCNQLDRLAQSSLHIVDPEKENVIRCSTSTNVFRSEWEVDGKNTSGAEHIIAVSPETGVDEKLGTPIYLLGKRDLQLQAGRLKTSSSTDSNEPEDMYLKTQLTWSSETHLSGKPQALESADLAMTTKSHLVSRIQIHSSPEPHSSGSAEMLLSPKHHKSYRTQKIQSKQSYLSPRTEIVESAEVYLLSRTQTPKSQVLDISFRTEILQSQELDSSSRTQILQSLEPELTFKTFQLPKIDMTQSPEPDQSFRDQTVLSPEPQVFLVSKMDPSILSDLPFTSQMIMSLEPQLSLGPLAAQSPEHDLPFGNPSNLSPETELSYWNQIKSSENDLSFEDQTNLSPEHQLSLVSRIAQSPETDLSFGIQTNVSPEPQLSLVSPLAESPECDLTFRNPDLVFEPQLSSAEPQMSLALESHLPHELTMMQSPQTPVPSTIAEVPQAELHPQSCPSPATLLPRSPRPVFSSLRTLRPSPLLTELLPSLTHLPSPPLLTRSLSDHLLLPASRPPSRTTFMLKRPLSAQAPCFSPSMSMSGQLDNEFVSSGSRMSNPDPYKGRSCLGPAVGDSSDTSRRTSTEPSMVLQSPSQRELTQLDLCPSGRTGFVEENDNRVLYPAAGTEGGGFDGSHDDSIAAQPLSIHHPAAKAASSGAGSVSSLWSGCSTRTPVPPLPRPLSRAAQEIQEIEGVDCMESEDPLLEQAADQLALACLEEELQGLSAESGGATDVTPCDPWTVSPSPPLPRALYGDAATTSDDSEGHTDEEEEARSDRDTVMSLP